MEKKKSIKLEAETTEKKKYPIGRDNYTLYEEIGQGVSATVHRALCKPFNEIVAIKILDFERDNCDLNSVFRETQTMVMIDHPNVLKSHCSFVCGHDLWVVMPYMAGGSCLHILKSGHSKGLPEIVIATILREILKGLEYLHRHGHIHRDVKSGNILIDSRGGIKLGDFGVSACLFDSGDRQRSRNTFVGTPCWMAPEVMEQSGYDFRADIWSFGITALELAHGNAPFSRFPPMKVLLMTLQTNPPGLENRNGVEFTTSFKHMVGTCLLKDPSKRPTAKKLLKHSFFKQARSSDYISRTLLEGLPALAERVMELKKKDDIMVAHKLPGGQIEEMSQCEYKRGISGWFFDLDLFRATLNQDIEEHTEDPVSDHSQPSSSNSPPLEEKNSLIQFVDSTLSNNDGTLQGRVATPVDDVVYDDSSKQPKSPVLDSDEHDEKAKEPIVQQRGRFKVTSENVDVEKVASNVPSLEKSPSMQVLSNPRLEKSPSMQAVSNPRLEKSQSMQTISRPPSQLLISPTLASRPSSPPNYTSSNSSTLFSFLNAVLESNIVQRDIILNIMKHTASGGLTAEVGCSSTDFTERNLLEEAHAREKELLQEIIDLKERTLSFLKEGQRKSTTDNEA